MNCLFKRNSLFFFLCLYFTFSLSQIQDGSFELNNGAWTFYSSGGSSILTEITSSSSPINFTVNGGLWYAWLGGYFSSELDSVSQNVKVPFGTLSLSFYICPYWSSTIIANYFEVTLNNNVLWTLTAQSSQSYNPNNWTQIILPISNYANGSTYNLTFFLQSFNNTATQDLSSVFLDDISLISIQTTQVLVAPIVNRTNNNVGVIAGVVVAFVALIIVLIVIILFFFFRKRNRSKPVLNDSPKQPLPEPPKSQSTTGIEFNLIKFIHFFFSRLSSCWFELR